MKLRLPFLTLTVAIAAVGIHLLPGAPALLEFDRAAIAQGELWRWLSGHLTHFESNHLVWDVGVLLLLGWGAEQESRRRFIRTVLWSATAISAAVWCWQPHLTQYRGLSGVDSALFGLTAGSLLRRRNRAGVVLGFVALLAIGGKSVLELATGSTVFAAGAGYIPVPLAHVVGLAVGLIMAFTRKEHAVAKDPSQQISVAAKTTRTPRRVRSVTQKKHPARTSTLRVKSLQRRSRNRLSVSRARSLDESRSRTRS